MTKFTHLESIQSLAVVGATGIVGKEFLSILADHKIKISRLKLLASEDSAGETLDVGGEEKAVEALTAKSFEGVEVAFFSVPNKVTKQYVPEAVKAGCLVVDDSSVFRMDAGVPLVIPQINGAVLRDFRGSIISTPNCSTTPVAMCLKPLADHYGIERVVVSTYQSVSGAGREAYDELSQQVIRLMNGTEIGEARVFPRQIAFNCLPQIGAVAENGNCEEEEKVVRELRKILSLPQLRVSATTVRVPTFCGHGASVNVELKRGFDRIEEIRELLDGFPGVKVVDQPSTNIYPTNLEAIGTDQTFVGRIRRDGSLKSGLNFWVITDNLRKGAALNCLEILETVYQYRRMN